MLDRWQATIGRSRRATGGTGREAPARKTPTGVRTAALGVLLCLLAPVGRSDPSVCARVELEIEQELTLEREGFEARLGITNGLPETMEDLRVTLSFTDAAGQPVAATTGTQDDPRYKFFHCVQNGYTEPGNVPAGESRKLVYLIVPTRHSGGDDPAGTLFYVGATVKYTVGGREEIAELAPDHIRVKPLPDLELQYFLPGDVHGDDPISEPIEPIIPFPLGVRVINHSPLAVTHRTTIQSAQPQIVRNDLELLVDFRIIGAEINGAPCAPTLRSEFGDIPPLRSAVGSWLLTSSLSGKFVAFSAEIMHAPELGGALTSIIPANDIPCRRLLGRVVVDLPGRDPIPDFLACSDLAGAVSEDNVTLHESDSADSAVAVHCVTEETGATLAPAEDGHTLFLPVDQPLVYVRVPSPIEAGLLVRAVRSDGKVLPAQNCWISRTKDARLAWVHTLNLFDTDKRPDQSYALTYSNPPQQNRAPRLTIVGGRTFPAVPGRPLYIDLSAQDPDGTIPALSIALLPDGATFTDHGNGRGYLSWTPAAGLEGSYAVQFKASDGALADLKSATVIVRPAGTDGYAGWSAQFWPGAADPAVSGAEADPDGDGITNLMEYALGSDPTASDTSLLPAAGIDTVDGERFLSLTFWRRAAASDLEYRVLGSASLHAPLSAWLQQTDLQVLDEPATPHDYECVKVRDSVAIEDSPGQRYLRLSVELKKAETP